MPDHYALVGPDNIINRIEPAHRVDPTVTTKAGWRWLPCVDEMQPSVTALQSAERADRVEGNQVIRGWSISTRAPISADVTNERNRRLRTFSFGGKVYQFDDESQLNIAGAGTLALAAIINGAQPGNLRWADGSKDFAWLAADNTSVTMDAQTTFAFAQAAARWKADHIHAARAIKDLSPIPEDYAANARWPS